ncbi:MAG: arginine--tRNA ligase [Actinomycetota bacterium]
MSMLDELSDLVGKAFAAAGLNPEFGKVVVSSRPELAQFQCNGALAAAKVASENSRHLADRIAAQLEAGVEPARAALAKVEVAGPGFINLTVTDQFLAEQTQRTETDPLLRIPRASPPLVVLVDYAGPNVAKAMHAGHLRATIIGDSLARLFHLLGHRVIRDPHFGDWGLQMGLLIVAIEERHPDLPYFDSTYDGPYPDGSPVTLADLQEIYPAASERSDTDEEWAERARRATVELQQGRPGYVALWRHMKRVSEVSQRADFSSLGVEFDLWYGESDVADRLAPLVERLRHQGLAVESEGALIVSVDQAGDKRELPPLILETSLGGFLYSTTDLATVDLRINDLDIDLALYVVDARQSDHLEQVFRAARLAGIAPPSVHLEHIRFGTMNGSDGKPFKTRAGGVVSLSDLIRLVETAARAKLEEADIAQDYPAGEREQIAHLVGVAALKFGDLINNRNSDYLFDPGRFASFEGKTGPYLQYGAVRIRSIQRKAVARGLRPGPVMAPVVEAERDLMLQLLQLPPAVGRATELRAPNHVAEFAYDLASTWNRFYDACHILDEADPARQASWLGLADLTLRTLTLALDTLGIEIPDRM